MKQLGCDTASVPSTYLTHQWLDRRLICKELEVVLEKKAGRVAVTDDAFDV